MNTHTRYAQLLTELAAAENNTIYVPQSLCCHKTLRANLNKALGDYNANAIDILGDHVSVSSATLDGKAVWKVTLICPPSVSDLLVPAGGKNE